MPDIRYLTKYQGRLSGIQSNPKVGYPLSSLAPRSDIRYSALPQSRISSIQPSTKAENPVTSLEPSPDIRYPALHQGRVSGQFDVRSIPCPEQCQAGLRIRICFFFFKKVGSGSDNQYAKSL